MGDIGGRIAGHDRFLDLAAGRFEVKFLDHNAEDGVVQGRPHGAEQQQPPTVSGFRVQHDEIDGPVRERHAVLDAQFDAQEIGDARQQGMNEVQHWRDEHEGEFDRLGDAGQPGGQRRRKHDAADLGAILRAGTVPNRNRRRRQAPHLEQIAARHVAGGGVAGDVALDFAGDDLAGGRVQVTADLEKERYVPDVMQTEGDQQAFDDAVDRERQCRIAFRRPMGKALDAGADGWPQETEHDPEADGGKGGDDGDETFAGEEAR